jgi:aspartate/methionine/tyrosine aminotransferase
MISQRAASFTESVIREMTRLCQMYGGVNLAQGFPDFDPPAEIVEAACAALRAGRNQYAITWGTRRLREAISARVAAYNGIAADPEAMITVTCGTTEAMAAAMLAVVDPGERVILFAPFYENYGPDTILCGAEPVYVRMQPPEWRFDAEELAAAFRMHRPRAIVVNTPHNPTGHVFTREELKVIAGLCQEHDCLAITDEIYEQIIYDGREHISLATLPGMAERTITISGLSKTYSVTGWRLGYAIAPPEIALGIRRIHDFLTVGAPHPLQEAAVAALSLPQEYYERLRAGYTERRDLLLALLRAAGLRPGVPEGAYYTVVPVVHLGWGSDVEVSRRLVQAGAVATVPFSSFMPPGDELGRRCIRFAFPKRLETLRDAGERLRRVLT